MEGDRNPILRRAVLFGVPILYAVLGFLHPTANPEVGDETSRFIWLHFAQLVLIGGLACMAWLLVDGLESRAARVARALILPFVILYTAVDAVLGIAWGLVAEKANELPAAGQASAGRLVDKLVDDPEPLGMIFYFAAGLSWLAVVVAVVIALRRIAPLGALILMTAGALVFTLGHAQPMGPIGMALFLAGVVWYELFPRRARAPRTVSVQRA